MDMDIVIYSDSSSTSESPGEDDAATKKKKKLGAIQEDGTLLPLTAWKDEPAFGNLIEFVVDEQDRVPGGIQGMAIETIIPQESLSYGSRQVGGGKGPGNPHGEESELLYYVDKDLLTNVEIRVNPKLEILW